MSLAIKNVFLFFWGLSLFFGQVPAEAKELCTFRYTIDPNELKFARHNMRARSAIRFMETVHQTLVRQLPSDEIVSGLARSWEINEEENSVTFEISSQCGWSDGAPITVKDIAAGLRALYMFDEPNFAGWSVIRGATEIFTNGASVDDLGIEIIDDTHLKIYISGPIDVALYALSMPSFVPIPLHASENEVYANNSAQRLFSGPFYVKENSPEMIKIVRNPYFCPYIPVDVDEVTVRFTKTNEENYWLFLKGDIDMIEQVSVAQAQTIIENWKGENKPVLMYKKLARQYNLFVHPINPILADRQMRALILDAIDIKALTQGLETEGFKYQIANSVLHDFKTYQSVGFHKNSDNSPEKARAALRQLMEAKGYNENNMARLVIKTYPIQRFERFAKRIASQLRQAHIALEFVPLKENADFQKSFSDLSADMHLASWTLDMPHVMNSVDGFVAHYKLLKQADGAWRYYGSESNFLSELEMRFAQASQSSNRNVLQERVRTVEKLLNDRKIVMPLFREMPPVLISNKYEFGIYDAFQPWVTAMRCKAE